MGVMGHSPMMCVLSYPAIPPSGCAGATLPERSSFPPSLHCEDCRPACSDGGRRLWPANSSSGSALAAVADASPDGHAVPVEQGGPDGRAAPEHEEEEGFAGE